MFLEFNQQPMPTQPFGGKESTTSKGHKLVEHIQVLSFTVIELLRQNVITTKEARKLLKVDELIKFVDD